MVDNYGRDINYMRISVTDRCNMRCKYCMPSDIELCTHSDVLSYEEILRICRVAVSLGIVNFKITGGEPLVRKNCINFLRQLKNIEGVKTVSLTTNGSLLSNVANDLQDMKINGVNISIDSLNNDQYDDITGNHGMLSQVLDNIKLMVNLGIHTKINCVLLEETSESIIKIAKLAEQFLVDVKFIELMPVGFGRKIKGISADEALSVLKSHWQDLRQSNTKNGNGPAVYYQSKNLKGKIGFIHAVSSPFCDNCNRIRLTSDGVLKPCLCFESGIELKPLLRNGSTDGVIRETIKVAIEEKPKSHCFSDLESMTEDRMMSQIGG